MIKSLYLLCFSLFSINVLFANTPENWSKPVEPFKIADNTWYIGTEGLAALLIKTDKGAILIDGGLPNAAKMLIKSMKKLGVKPNDLKWILYTHAHYDHAGPLAEIKRTTKALIASSAESATLSSRGDKDDIHYGDKYPFEPFKTDRFVMDGEEIELGNVKVKVHFTPAHTPGSLSFTWTDKLDGKDINIAYVDSLSAPGYKLINNPRYPTIVDDYRKGFAKVRTLPCDLLITPHPEASGWTLMDATKPHAQPMNCKAFADKMELRLDDQIKAETKK